MVILAILCPCRLRPKWGSQAVDQEEISKCEEGKWMTIVWFPLGIVEKRHVGVQHASLCSEVSHQVWDLKFDDGCLLKLSWRCPHICLLLDRLTFVSSCWTRSCPPNEAAKLGMMSCARSLNTRCSEALFRRNYLNPGCEFAQPEWIDTEVHGLYPLLHLQVLLWEDASSPITRSNRFVPSTGTFGWELGPQNPNDHGWPSDHGADFARSPLGVWHLWYHVVLWACSKLRPFRKNILQYGTNSPIISSCVLRREHVGQFQASIKRTSSRSAYKVHSGF